MFRNIYQTIMGSMFSSNQERLSFVSTSVTATAPPISSVPAYNVSTDNDLRNRNTKTNDVYLPGFECLVNLQYCCIQIQLAGCGFNYDPWEIVVNNALGKQVLQVKQPVGDEQVFRRIKKRLQCNDSFGRPLFSLSRYIPDSGIQLPPAEGKFLGYIQSKQSTFFVLNNEQEVIIKTSLHPTSQKVTIVERYFPQAAGPRRTEKVGSLMARDRQILVNLSEDLDIALKACIIAAAIDSLLPNE